MIQGTMDMHRDGVWRFEKQPGLGEPRGPLGHRHKGGCGWLRSNYAFVRR